MTVEMAVFVWLCAAGMTLARSAGVPWLEVPLVGGYLAILGSVLTYATAMALVWAIR